MGEQDRSFCCSKDVFSSGQMSSKLWACEILEKYLLKSGNLTIWVYGGWVGLLGFLLLSRDRLSIRSIRSFDKDENHTKEANLLNENWVWQEWKFRAITFDCNQLSHHDLSQACSERPNLVVNTSVEHFEETAWWEQIPKGTYVLNQSTDLLHDEETNGHSCEDELADSFPMSKILYKGKKNLRYNDFELNRYMVFGIK